MSSSTGDLRREASVPAEVIGVLAQAVTSELEERAGVAMYLALSDLRPGRSPRPPADRQVRDGTGVAAELARWVRELGLDDGSDAVQHTLATLAALHVRPRPPITDTGAAPESVTPGAPLAPLVVLPGYAPSRPGALGRVVDAFCAGRLVRFVNYHNTPARQREELERELADYARRYRCLRPEELVRAIDTGRYDVSTGGPPGDRVAGADPAADAPSDPRPGLVLAFFDGMRNAVEVGAPACERAGLTGWFFPPTAFLDTPPAQQREFADAHDIILVEEERAAHGPVAMTWDELAVLGRRHAVCAHTGTHATAAAVRTPADIAREVTGPVRRLTELTGQVPAAFAWLGGTPFDAASPASRAVREAGVPLLVSGLAVERLG